MDSALAPHQAFLNTKTFGALDGLRAFSILSVVLYHVAETHEGLVGRLYLGVSLFFAISGFLITTLLLRERDKTGDISLKGFYARRSLRIFPLYYAVTFVYVAVVYFLEKDPHARGAFFEHLPYFLTYTTNWFINLDDGRVIFYFVWSLATEEQFYLLWPFVVRSFRSAWGPVVFMAGLLGLALFARWGVSAGQLDTHLLGVRMMASISPSICMGCLAAYLTHSPRTFAWVWRVLGQAWSVPLAVGLMAVALYRYDTPAWLVSLLLTVLVVAMCVRPRHVLTPLVEHPWLRYIGGITYGIYLLHMLSLNVVRRVVPFHDVTVYFVLTLGLSVVLATLSYRYFETPFLKLKHRFDWRGDKPPAPAPRPVASTSPSAS